jgi:4-hydroxy-tetrahydrodipicolinate synthase
VLLGDSRYELHFNQDDRLSPSQQAFAKSQLNLFQTWWNNWAGKTYRTDVPTKKL